MLSKYIPNEHILYDYTLHLLVLDDIGISFTL